MDQYKNRNIRGLERRKFFQDEYEAIREAIQRHSIRRRRNLPRTEPGHGRDRVTPCSAISLDVDRCISRQQTVRDSMGNSDDVKDLSLMKVDARRGEHDRSGTARNGGG